MIKQIVVCDVCGKQRGDVNRWWLVLLARDTWHIMPWADSAKLEDFVHLCGEECAVKSMSKFMQEYGK